ncbi:MAG: hypothetical protein K2F63_04780, partial [Muribaculaceae bacterium]|nr:hypothetical protein [Muribaculaceae bacterium]
MQKPANFFLYEQSLKEKDICIMRPSSDPRPQFTARPETTSCKKAQRRFVVHRHLSGKLVKAYCLRRIPAQ